MYVTARAVSPCVKLPSCGDTVGNREASLISRDATPVKRHRNPVGIFSRVLIYPLIGVGAWRHRLDLVVAGAALEALLWTAVPPGGGDVRVRGGRHREGAGVVERAFRAAENPLVRPAGPVPRRHVRGPVEALLASARRVRGPHRHLLSPHAERRCKGVGELGASGALGRSNGAPRGIGGTRLYGRNLISFKGNPHHLALH